MKMKSTVLSLLALGGLVAGSAYADGSTYNIVVNNHAAFEGLKVMNVRDEKSYLFSHGVQGSVTKTGELFTSHDPVVQASAPLQGTFTIPSGSALGVYMNLKTTGAGNKTSWGFGCRVHLVANADGTVRADTKGSGFNWISKKMCENLHVTASGHDFVIDFTPPVDAKRI